MRRDDVRCYPAFRDAFETVALKHWISNPAADGKRRGKKRFQSPPHKANGRVMMPFQAVHLLSKHPLTSFIIRKRQTIVVLPSAMGWDLNLANLRPLHPDLITTMPSYDKQTLPFKSFQTGPQHPFLIKTVQVCHNFANRRHNINLALFCFRTFSADSQIMTPVRH